MKPAIILDGPGESGTKGGGSKNRCSLICFFMAFEAPNENALIRNLGLESHIEDSHIGMFSTYPHLTLTY